MTEPASPKKKGVDIIQLLPNLLTISAICAGLTAIRFGYEANYEMAVKLILAACVLDGLDGRLARMMKSTSAIGAELDSLADFLNFGVAPVLVLHSWSLGDSRAGWIAVLCYSVCCVLRLARFNVSSRMESEGGAHDFFVGVPSPAGAVLVMFPMVVSFAVTDMSPVSPLAVSVYVGLIGLLMISRIPTYAFRNISVGQESAKFYLLGGVLLVAALLTYLWTTLALLTLVYFGCLIWGFKSARKDKDKK
ncbi:CDP-diacylglycerol-serine O-phosphatidyltransferase [Shimia thalassica]|uniref:CDP-diacylglycerol--serine O-phosphatidyltransferase n=1 Tax=Shimia thalassica TaxID=1715693 RepID=A0A0P1I7D6_9RHOB|nr:CDP-diacylglycerol--serine O-phosphatidyltransferase [Shimia thalassica]CUJ95277.1 CDP-diacylglycerol-serine O-phosphatidyltransferase [Shimia thalassica]